MGEVTNRYGKVRSLATVLPKTENQDVAIELPLENALLEVDGRAE